MEEVFQASRLTNLNAFLGVGKAAFTITKT